jgi:hypothetical protein
MNIRDPQLSEAGKTLRVRFHITDRHIEYERPRMEALESYREPGGWNNWRQHPWTPSGILPMPADPEAAWADFIEWCQGPPLNGAEPPLRKESYIAIFTSPDPPYHAWELRQPSDPANAGGAPTADQASP